MSTKTPAPTTDLKSMLRNPSGIALVAYYLLMAIVGMLVPDDILKSHEWAREFSNFMAGIVPQIDRVTALNIKPDVNRFYFSVLWAGSPVLVVIVVVGALMHGINSNYLQPNISSLKLITAGFVGSGMCLAAMYMPFAASSPKLTKGLIEFFLGRGFFAQVIFVNGPIIFLTAIWINFPYFLVTGQYRKAKAKKYDVAIQIDSINPKKVNHDA